MPRGGRRPGAGRKPNSAKVVNINGKPRADILPPSMQASSESSSATGLAEPPEDLSPARKAFWREWAPRAIAESTLTDATVLGFRELSEQYVIKDDLAKRVEQKAPGWGEDLKLWTKVTQRVDASMARFKLTAFGKSIAPPKPKASSSVWGAVAAPAIGRK